MFSKTSVLWRFCADQCEHFHKNGGFSFHFCTKTMQCERDLTVHAAIVMFSSSLLSEKPYGGRPLKYECPQCQRRFHAPSHLKRHVMSHSSERPFQCDVCGKGFLQAWHLGRHMTTHTGNKPFKCMECAKSFGSRFEMKTHINYIHKGKNVNHVEENIKISLQNFHLCEYVNMLVFLHDGLSSFYSLSTFQKAGSRRDLSKLW